MEVLSIKELLEYRCRTLQVAPNSRQFFVESNKKYSTVVNRHLLRLETIETLDREETGSLSDRNGILKSYMQKLGGIPKLRCWEIWAAASGTAGGSAKVVPRRGGDSRE